MCGLGAAEHGNGKGGVLGLKMKMLSIVEIPRISETLGQKPETKTTHTHIHACTSTHKGTQYLGNIFICLYLDIYIYVCVWNICIYAYVILVICMRTCVCMYATMCVHLCMCVYVWYVCMYLKTFRKRQSSWPVTVTIHPRLPWT